MDWQALLYGPVYATLGVEAVLTLCGGEPPIALTVLDKTAGIVVGGQQRDRGRFQAEVETIQPAAAVRAAELANVDRDKLHGAEIAFNGKCWKIDTHAFRPSPRGEGDGEILLLLTER
ncbi:hypothetical protein [Mesorhizobium sp. B4-1-1]|uniref:hypothetical protein n=1 Tax=Mesorhizobium sp. B4-1-1 TaxID=2589890 RepID=UPI001125D989|nr:hypothetical protein [Mesorhizobium sp. B4-1-1]TPI13866.1 hypothetical protein FJW10_25675 [Mesorhizobium sp. B4-1-1]